MNSVVPRFRNYEEQHLNTVEFNSVDELMEIDFIKSWAKHPRFSRFSIVINEEKNIMNSILLMVELTDDKYYVVGYLKEPVDLPIWSKITSN